VGATSSEGASMLLLLWLQYHSVNYREQIFVDY